jgi:hypothetical protein
MSRQTDILKGMRAQGERKKEALERLRKRNAQDRPWKVLQSFWFEEHWRVFGKDVDATRWGAAELSLAKKVLNEVSLERAQKMVAAMFFAWGGRDGLPSFKLFWAMRGGLKAKSEGKGPEQAARKERQRFREYDKDKAAAHPRFGWHESIESADSGKPAKDEKPNKKGRFDW